MRDAYDWAEIHLSNREVIMSDTNEANPRRRFLKVLSAGVVAAPVVAALSSRFALAEDLPHLEETDPTAMALGYKHDVAAPIASSSAPRVTSNGHPASCSRASRSTGLAGAPVTRQRRHDFG